MSEGSSLGGTAESLRSEPLPSEPPAEEPLRLCLVTETFSPEINGVARTLDQLVRGMMARGHRVEVVHPRRRGVAEDVEHFLVPGLPLPGYPELRFGLPVARRLRRRWSQDPPTVVHVATEGPLGFAATFTARKLGIPVLSTFHTNFHDYGRHYGYGLLRRAVLAGMRYFHNRTAATLVPTEEIRRGLESSGFQRVGVLARGVDTKLFSPQRRDDELRARWDARPSAPVLSYVGRIAGEKDVALALEAFRRARRAVPDSRAVVVGDGPHRQRSEEAYPEVVFCGMRTGEDLGRHYASGDVFVFPSRTETFGNVVLEAMASGLVVVAFDRAAAHELIVSGENGFTVPGDDRQELAELAAAVARRPLDELRAIGARARVTALGSGWDAVVKRYEAALFGVLTGGS
ncbi:MAG: glycosyltransferase family 1 protein [Acidobacteriota bacterium]|nr:glycosyltransferase family 1 protein [Acidobacteriota bacterium]